MFGSRCCISRPLLKRFPEDKKKKKTSNSIVMKQFGNIRRGNFKTRNDAGYGRSSMALSPGNVDDLILGDHKISFKSKVETLEVSREYALAL